MLVLHTVQQWNSDPIPLTSRPLTLQLPYHFVESQITLKKKKRKEKLKKNNWSHGFSDFLSLKLTDGWYRSQMGTLRRILFFLINVF